MIYKLYSNSDFPTFELSLAYNQAYLSRTQGHNSPFYFKKEIAIWAFDARVTTMFYELLSGGVSTSDKSQIDDYIKKYGMQNFL
jgi:hypothetical protein